MATVLWWRILQVWAALSCANVCEEVGVERFGSVFAADASQTGPARGTRPVVRGIGDLHELNARGVPNTPAAAKEIRTAYVYRGLGHLRPVDVNGKNCKPSPKPACNFYKAPLSWNWLLDLAGQASGHGSEHRLDHG